jgi:hypothetical protein
MSVASPDELLQHLREATGQAVTYVDGLAKEDFLADKRTQQAVILNIVILGEVATKLMDHFLTRPPPIHRWNGVQCAACATALLMATTTSTSTWCGRLCRLRCRN